MRITPETYFQNSGGTLIRRVEAFKRIVNSTIDSANEAVTMYGYHFHFSHTDPARITGRTGRTHGARIVRTPAMNDTNTRESIKWD